MTQRKYTLQDVYEYLKKYYNLDWRFGKVLAEQEKDGTFKFKYGGKDESKLNALADVYIGESKEHLWLDVNNEDFIVKKLNPRLKEIKIKPEISWKDFITKRHNQTQETTL